MRQGDAFSMEAIRKMTLTSCCDAQWQVIELEWPMEDAGEDLMPEELKD